MVAVEEGEAVSTSRLSTVADLLEWALAQDETARCMFCPDWLESGTAKEVHEAQRAHRQASHPELKQRRRQRGGLRKFRTNLSEEQTAELAEERERRMRLLGIL